MKEFLILVVHQMIRAFRLAPLHIVIVEPRLNVRDLENGSISAELLIRDPVET